MPELSESEFLNYKEYDEQYTSDVCKKVILTPIWGFRKDWTKKQGWQSMKTQVKCKVIGHNYFSLFYLSDEVNKCLDLFFGYDSPTNGHPCETFQTKTKLISGIDWPNTNGMVVRMKFSPKVQFAWHFADLYFFRESFGFNAFLRWGGRQLLLSNHLWTAFCPRC